jgi:thioesterase domain-containing protein
VTRRLPSWVSADAPAAGEMPDITSGSLRGPRDATELTLSRIWQENLGVTRLPLDADYFAAGGTSLGAVRLLARVREQTGADLRLEQILDAPTVEKMSVLVRSGTAAAAPSCLLDLRAGTRRPALACLHPIGGTVLWYRHLADALPDGVPVLGLQARGLLPGHEPDRDIPAMAARYRAETLRRFRPGELVLAGYSFGGLVAYELACQLAAAGTPPRGVLLLDTAVRREPEDRPTRARMLWSLVGHALGLDVDVEALAALDPPDRAARILALATEQGTLPPGFGVDRLMSLIDIYPVNAEAERRYQLPRYPGPADLILPREGRADRESREIWAQACAGGLRVHEVPGDHFNLIAEDRVTAVAAVISRLWYPDEA